MAIDLHTRVENSTSLAYQFLPERKQGQVVTVTLPPQSRDHNHSNINDDSSSSALKPHVLIPHQFGSSNRASSSSLPPSTEINEDQELVAELTRQMEQFMLQGDDKFDFSGIGSRNYESLSWDSSMSSPQSTLRPSPMGSPEGLSREPSPSSPGKNSRDFCWETTNDVVGMFEKMRLDQRDNNPKYHHNNAYEILSSKSSNVGRTSSHQSLIQEQIRAIQLSRLKQEQILSLKQKLAAYREFESNENIRQFQKKGVNSVGFDNRCRTRMPQQGPLLHQQQPGSEMQAHFLGGSDSRGASCGTGVFLPRGTISASSESRKRPGKGCSNILIPARVVQALQLHFDQMSATSGPKPAGFPPLHDVLVSNRDGMYSLQKRQSRKAPANMQNEMILPQEWTY